VDALDRRIAAALQLHGRATWREVAKVVGASESTVARRARQLLDSELVRVTGQAEPARMGFGFPVIVHVACTPGKATQVARALASRPDVRFLTLVTGAYDVVLELIVPSRRQLQRVLVTEIAVLEGVAGTTTDHVMRTFKTSYDWSRGLLDAQGIDPSFGRDARAEPKTEDLALDAIDLRLIQLLGEDGRRGYSELANVLGISESMARLRFSALVDHGYLTLATFVDPEVLGYDVEALVWLDVDLRRIDRITPALTARPEVRYLSAVAGASNLMCEVILRSPADLYDFSTKTLGSLEGIRRIAIEHELVTLKRAYVEAVPAFMSDSEATGRAQPVE
jgi:DNA-binding Lrp family transcriptional regulator